MAQTDHDRPARSRRRWLRFSLKTVFVLVTLYCVWLAIVTLQAHRQQRAVAHVQQLGGFVVFGFELDVRGNWKSNPQPFVPLWIRRAVGEEYFRSVAIVDVAAVPNQLTDEDLQVFGNFSNLQQIVLTNHSEVTDSSLARFSGLKHLRVLQLEGTRVTGQGLPHLRALRQLEFLVFSSTPLTDAGLEQLRGMTNLKSLLLSDTKISDEGLRHVADLRSLEYLDLANTDITDAGVKHLETLYGLKRILLRGTKTTHEGRAALQKALPNCRMPD